MVLTIIISLIVMYLCLNFVTELETFEDLQKSIFGFDFAKDQFVF
jgi:hypothetical protein